jgi:hypothetical protein
VVGLLALTLAACGGSGDIPSANDLGIPGAGGNGTTQPGGGGEGSVVPGGSGNGGQGAGGVGNVVPVDVSYDVGFAP